MPVHPVFIIAVALLAGACAGSSADPLPPAAVAPTAAADPPAAADPVAADPPASGRSAGAPDSEASTDGEEVVLAIPVGTLPDGTRLEVVVRSLEVDGRREVTTEAPDGVADRHVIDGDQHWWWLAPAARSELVEGDVEWIHLDVAEVTRVGDLPDLVADARVPLPRPGEVDVGLVVAGHEVVDVERVGADEDHLHLDGLDEPAVLRRRVVRGAEIELPAGAVELGDLAGELGW